MEIAIIQTKLFFGDVEKNYKLMEEKIIEAAKKKPDTIFLSEMWNTSFFPKNIKELADKDGSRTKGFLSNLSRELNINIVGGSVATIKEDKLFNTSYVFNRKGELVGSYDKVHSFSPAGEHEVFEPGDKLCIFEIDGIKCGLSICYDLRFAEWIRMHALENISLFFLPAAWPDKRILHWNVLNRARAIENQMFVICSNSIGSTDKMKFGGNSAIINPWGEYVIEPDDKDEIKTGSIDISIIKGIKESINVFKDRKKGFYKL